MAVGEFWNAEMTFTPSLSSAATNAVFTWQNLNPSSPGAVGATISTISYGVALGINIINNNTASTSSYFLAASGSLYFNAAEAVPTYLFESHDVTLYGTVPTASTVQTEYGGITGFAATGGTVLLAVSAGGNICAGYFQVTGSDKYNIFSNPQALYGNVGIAAFIEQ